MKIDKDTLEQNYRTKSDDELLRLHRGCLTELAYEVIEAELAHRGITIPKRPRSLDDPYLTPLHFVSNNDTPSITLSAIEVITKNGAVKGAIISLSVWGTINLGAWYILGRNNLDFLAKINNPSPDLQIVFYGSAIIGLIMLLFAAIGVITRAAFTISLNGLSLIGVGVWNLIFDEFANSSLRPYGYIINSDTSTIWYVLGVSQLVWGFRQLARFDMVSLWANAKCSSSEVVSTKKYLTSLMKESERFEHGRIKAYRNNIQYVGWFSGENIMLVSTSMNDFVLITKEIALNATFKANGKMGITTDRGYVTLWLDEPSLLEIKDWCSKNVNVQDTHDRRVK